MGVSLAAIAAGLVVLAAIPAAGARRSTVRRRLGSGNRLARHPRLLTSLGWLLPGRLVSAQDEAIAGAAVLGAACVAVLVDIVAAVVVLVAALIALEARRRARLSEQTRLVERVLPEVIDLLVLVIGAGRSTSAALRDIGPRVPEPFRSELTGIARRMDAGEPFADSVRRLRDRLGPSVASVVYAITAAEIDGAPLQPALERAADEAHRRRRVRAEEAARRVPIMMLFPLVFCILPAFCLLTVVPILTGTVTDLRLAI